MGELRRQARAEAVASSTAIEGFEVPPEQAFALVSGRDIEAGVTDVPRLDRSRDVKDRLAVACYARAMDHVGVMAGDPHFRWLDRVILDLHFDATYFQPDKHPGRWRDGSIAVTGDAGGVAYRAPDGDDVVPLMGEVVDWLETEDLGAHSVVRAAMAHLQVVSVHPFEDGNGRISRIVQSLVLAREGTLPLELGSIEPYLAENTSAYYAALQDAQGGSYQPDRDASGWVDFCVDAHLAQARRRLAQCEQAAQRWSYLEELVERRDWPDRLVIALEQSLLGGSDRARYCEEADVSTATASNDFRRLLDAGLVEQHGRGPKTRYFASESLRSQVKDARTH